MLRKSTPPQHSEILKDELDLRDIMKTAFQPMIYSTSFTPVKEKFDKITEQQKEEINCFRRIQNLHCPKGAKFTIRADFLVKENYLVLGLLFWISQSILE